MVTAYVSRITPPDDNEVTTITISKFAAAAPGNVVSVDETDAGETDVLSLIAEGMRHAYNRFPELLLVDGKHKTNRLVYTPPLRLIQDSFRIVYRYNYQIMTVMVMNEFGEGRPVQQSLIEVNGNWHMGKAIEQSKRTHMEAAARHYRG
jgi:hypothetical protein